MLQKWNSFYHCHVGIINGLPDPCQGHGLVLLEFSLIVSSPHIFSAPAPWPGLVLENIRRCSCGPSKLRSLSTRPTSGSNSLIGPLQPTARDNTPFSSGFITENLIRCQAFKPINYRSGSELNPLGYFFRAIWFAAIFCACLQIYPTASGT